MLLWVLLSPGFLKGSQQVPVKGMSTNFRLNQYLSSSLTFLGLAHLRIHSPESMFVLVKQDSVGYF